MRYLIISDLHGNWEALQAVLENASSEYDRIVCCGDLVGYGPDPDRIVEWARRHVDVVVRGNHDRACCGLEDLEWFNEVAQIASRWTMAHLTQADLAWLRDLPRGPVMVDGFSIAHGSPLDEDEYVTTLADASNVVEYVEAALTFIGHTHLQGGFYWLDGRQWIVRGPEAPRCVEPLRIDPDGVYLMNPGSVGQPRDGDPRAAYCLFDADKRDLRLLRAVYDYEAVRRKIETAGLPPVLGSRLALGR